MSKIEETLLDFFKAWSSDEHSRYFSWEHCYYFFKKNQKCIINNNDNLLDEASLHLSFYLASWGMYRGSSNLLLNDYKIHKNLVKSLIQNCDYLWNDNITWEELETARNIIKKHYSTYNITPTDTLITKVLLGIFGCVPAFDNFFKCGLKIYNRENNKKIPFAFNKSCFNELCTLAKTITLQPEFKNYPRMRLIDTYFWWTGGGKEAHKKRAKV